MPKLKCKQAWECMPDCQLTALVCSLSETSKPPEHEQQHAHEGV